MTLVLAQNSCSQHTKCYSSPIRASSAKVLISQFDVSLALIRGRSSSLAMLILLPVPLLLSWEGLLLTPELLVLEPSLLLVFVKLLSALDLPLLMLSLSLYSGTVSMKLDCCCEPEFDSRFGVGEGVISVDAEISTNSASRYHFRRRVYRPQPSWPRRPFIHCGGCQFYTLSIAPTIFLNI